MAQCSSVFLVFMFGFTSACHFSYKKYGGFWPLRVYMHILMLITKSFTNSVGAAWLVHSLDKA